MAQYKTGSVSVTNGSAVVTGTGTLWVGEVAVGDIFTIVGSNAWYEVGSVDSNTQITLTANYAGATITDSTYAISRDFTANYGLPYPQKGDIETASLIKRAFQDIDSKLVLTSSSGDVTITGDLIVAGSTISLDNATVQTFTWGDNDKAIFGDGSDLQIYHDGTQSKIEDVGTGALSLRTNGTEIFFYDSTNAQFMSRFVVGGAVNLYHNGSAKLATTSTGIDVTGTVVSDGLTVDSGSATNNVEIVSGVPSTTTGTSTLTLRPYNAGTGTTYSRAEIIGESTGAGDTDLVFKTTTTSTGSVQRMRIDDLGDISFYEDTGTTAKFFWDASEESLGIGTSSISAVGTRTTLHVAGASGSAIRLSDDTANAFLDYTDASGMRISVNANEPLTIRTNSLDRLIIDGAGNLGFGVTPSGWGGTYKAFDVNTTGYIYGSGTSLGIGENAYYNGTSWIYKTTSEATLYATLAGEHRWFTAPSGTAGGTITFSQAMTLDASGRLGIGTSSPTQRVQIGNPSDANQGMLLYFPDADNAAIYTTRFSTGSLQSLQVGAQNTLKFLTNATERARIDVSGNLLVGKVGTSLNYTGFQYNTGGYAAVTTDGAIALALNRQNTDGTIVTFYRGTTSSLGSTVGTISVTTTSTSYNTSSDYRLKEDWQPMTGASERVKALKPVNFAWKSDGSRVDGFLAHEAQAVVPEAVTGEKDAVDADGNPEYQGIDQSKLVPLLTAALQEALAKIESLEARLDAANL